MADSYYLELYPAGGGCGESGAYCLTTAGTSYSFTPLYSSYYYRVQGINTTCGASEAGAWGAANFTVYGLVEGTVRLDSDRQAELVGGKCSLAGAGGLEPGEGSQVAINGLEAAEVNGDGSYAKAVLLGSNQAASLSIGDLGEWQCTCPDGCVYSTSAPAGDLDFFVTNEAAAWWQADGGNVHADSGDVVSGIPGSATEPFLITGESGLVSYGGGVKKRSFPIYPRLFFIETFSAVL
ncbi:MAG: hypothetical protein FJZ96_01810 [Chloroflexi bacterium]|nr:hypothetical protein [Chloroflexota bacterium]